MNISEHGKYIFRLVCAIVIILAGIGWGVLTIIEAVLTHRSGFSFEVVLIPALGLCVSLIGVLLLIYTRREHTTAGQLEQENREERFCRAFP